MVRLALLAVAYATVMTGPVFAYLDPGTGSIILQSLIAGFAAAAATAGIYWQRLRLFASRMLGKDRPTERDPKR